MAEGPYTKLYHVLKDEYPSVWASDARLAAFVRLLVIADKWWPQRAPVGRRSAAYRALVSCGLVLEDGDGDSYSILGLDKDRTGRSHHGKHAALARWGNAPSNAPSNAHASPEGMPNKAEQNKAEQRDGHPANGAPETFLGWKPKDPKPGLHDGHHGKGCVACFPVGAA